MDTDKRMIQVTLEDGRVVSCAPHTTVARLLVREEQVAPDLPFLGALVNNDVVSLTYPLEVDCQLEALTMANPHGWRIYRRSLAFILAKVVNDLYPEARFSIEHSLGSGLYCNFEMGGEFGVSSEQLAAIEARLRDLVREDRPIQRHKISYSEAVARFEQEKQWDKYNLLRFRNPPKVVVYSCESFTDLAHGPLASSTGVLPHFRIISYPPGFVIQFPERETAPHMAPFERQPHLFQIFKEHKEWGRILNVQTVGQLNEIVARKEIGDFIKISEAYHEKKIVQLADRITAEREHIKWVCIAGPSSSGKTTFSKRLAVQLRVNGLRPVMISVDDYFVDRSLTPRDENGSYDFEHIETIDLALLNDHLEQLDAGHEVEMPRFNFETGSRVFKGHKLKIEPDQMVIIEGIHALNPRLTQTVPPEHKFKIYISALTQLNLDLNNRISTTDNRLVRRMVRDHQFRGNPALGTLQMWPSVRRGEKRWIFPFQKEADAAFNSALDYELGALKTLAEPLLCEVKPYHPQYAEARRLLDFLECFLSIPVDQIPATSILREFMGQSSFSY
jgi:uridine kinase